MDIINESSKSNLSKPKTDRSCYNYLKNKKFQEHFKSIVKKINLKKELNFNFKSQKINKIKFPKISSLYSSNTNRNPKSNLPKIKSDFLSDINNSSFKEQEDNFQKKDLSLNIFKNNDIDLVQNLNPDSNRDLISNLLLKQKVRNKLESQIDLFDYFKNNNSEDDDEEKNNIGNSKDEEKDFRTLKQKLLKISQSNLIEKELNYRLKEIRKKYNLKKMNKNEINNKFKEKLKEIDNIEYDIELLDYKAKENSLRNSQLIFSNSYDIKKQSNGFNFKNPKIKSFKLSKNEYTRRMNLLHEYFNKQKQTDNEKKMKKNQILEIQKEMKDLKTPLNLLNNEINELKTIEKNTKEELMKYYLELLYVGKEIRNEGLTWIIKGIWKLGENVPIEFMPKFLDFKAIKYLFNYAKTSVELDSIKKCIKELKQKLKEKVDTTDISNKNKNKEELTIVKNMNKLDNNNFKEKINFIKKFNENNRSTKNKNNISFFLLEKNNILRKKLLYSSSSPDLMNNIINLENTTTLNIEQNDIEGDLKSSVCNLSRILDKKKGDLYSDKMPEINEITNLSKKIILLNKQREEMKKNEIQRIFKEFIDNDYEKVYHAPIEVVLGALIGEHARNIQMNNYNIFRKGYLDELKTIRFFEYGKRNNFY